MPWQTSRPGGKGYVAPKYRDPKHKATRDALMAALTAAGIGRCCIGGEPIYPWMGSNLHLDHTPDGQSYRGLACADHNRRDGARRARAKQSPSKPPRGFTRPDW